MFDSKRTLMTLLALALVGLRLCMPLSRPNNTSVEIDPELLKSIQPPELRELESYKAAQKPAEATAKAFLIALREGRIAQAYDLTNAAFRSQFDPISFRELVAIRLNRGRQINGSFTISEDGRDRHHFMGEVNGTTRFTLVVVPGPEGCRIADITFEE
jgi:hypothetical protein